MQNGRLQSWSAALLVALMWAAPLRADAPSSGAREHYRRGLSAYGLGDFATAANEYEAAFKARPDPALLYNAAQAHRLAGNRARALELYQSYLRLFENEVPNRGEVERRIADLRAQLQRPARPSDAPPPVVTERPPAPPVVTERPPAPPVVTERPPAPPSAPPPVVAPPVAAPPVAAPSAAVAIEVAPDRAPRPWWKKGWVWGTVAGVAAAGLAVGLGVGLSAQAHDPTASMGTVKF